MKISDIMDEVWAGFSRTDCERFSGDDIDHVVRWKGQSWVNIATGYTRARFYMKNTDLYSFRVGNL